MKRNVFALLFISTHIIFIALQIHRHSLYIQYSYHKQKNEKMYDNLLKEQEMLVYELHTLHNNEIIKQYAQNKLNMMPTNLRHIKRVPHENSKKPVRAELVEVSTGQPFDPFDKLRTRANGYSK